MKADGITVALEKAVCDVLREYANKLAEDHDVYLDSVSFEWFGLCTTRKPKKVLNEVRVNLYTIA